MATGERCDVCGALGADEAALQRSARPDDDTHLPGAARRLELVRDLDPHGGRTRHLLRCPACRSFFLYRTDYTYLVGGWTEDEEFLTRLRDAEAAAYLAAPAG
jgi:hypothetical protein